MTYLIKRRTNDALMADRWKQYEAVFLNVNYNLFYFYSIIQISALSQYIV